MARPNITVLVDDQSFVVPFTESGSLTRAGMISHNGLIQALGSTAENKTGIMQINSVNEWLGRLNSTETLTGFNGTTLPYTNNDQADSTKTSKITELPFWHDTGTNGYSGGILATAGNVFAGGTYARWPLGPTGTWKNEWWAAHNYLQYGGVLIVGSTGSVEFTSISSSSNPLTDKQVPLDLVFANTGGTTEVTYASDIASTRQDCIAIIPTTGTVASPTFPSGYNADEFNVAVHGFKKHLDISRGIREDSVDDLITTPCAADVAGCFARTDAIKDPWWSPAGFKRGQILGVVRMHENPSDGQMDSMYDSKINPIVTFPGEGTVLFGDKTLTVPSSTLSRINVSRLFIFLKKTVGAAARDKLFELNDFETRLSFVNAVTPLMQTVKSRRGIYDYRIVCDESNNTPDIIDSNQFVADIFVKPAKSINFIRVRFTNKNTSDDLE
tara:strand:+ start:367 stop:1692 length:1326 start_codon:yes stop_codon:yes gene_type:complete